MPARAYFAALQHQTRARRWLAAAVAGAATGLFANLILDWPLTLSQVDISPRALTTTNLIGLDHSTPQT